MAFYSHNLPLLSNLLHLSMSSLLLLTLIGMKETSGSMVAPCRKALFDSALFLLVAIAKPFPVLHLFGPTLCH